MTIAKQLLSCVVSLGFLISTLPAAASPLPQAPAAQQGGENQQNAALTPQQIDNLVAPIALYPDALVAQILGGATHPDEIVEADRFVKANSKLSPSDLMTKVNDQPWDPSVKALTQFPSVLDNMSQNLSWTSALGEAAYYQQGDCMASVQRLRKQAKDAGNLKSTSQQTVVQQDPQTIVIQPANPQVVYVPSYNPTVVYGTPYSPPGYSTGAMVATGLISFGVGMAVGAAINNNCCGWGWNSWGCGWHGGTVVYNRNVYVSNSRVYSNGGRYYNNGYPRATPYGSNANVNRSGNRNTNISGNTVNINTGGNTNVNNRSNMNVNNRNNTNLASNNRNLSNTQSANPGGNYGANRAAGNNSPRQMPANDRGYGQRPAAGSQTGAFGGYGAGGNARAESNRGQASFGGGGGGRQAAAGRAGGRRR